MLNALYFSTGHYLFYFFAQIWLLWQFPLIPGNLDRIFEFADSENPVIHAINISISCSELKYLQFCLFCINLVAMATPFAPLKIQITYLKSPTPKTTPYMEKVSRYLVKFLDVSYRSEITCNFGLFWPTFGCHGNSLSFLENLDSIFEFADPYNSVIYANNFSISCTQLKSVQFWLIFAKFGCHGNFLSSLENLDTRFEFANPQLNPVIHAKNFSISCTELKSGQFWLIFAQHPLLPLKIQVAYLNSSTQKTLLYTQKCLNILYRNEVMLI